MTDAGTDPLKLAEKAFYPMTRQSELTASRLYGEARTHPDEEQG